MKHFLICINLFFSIGLYAQFQIGQQTITFQDPARNNRAIASEIYYPTTNGTIAAGQHPVIVFGHGFVMVYSAYQNIWEAFVPQGYIMVFPKTEGGFSPNHATFAADLAFLVGAMQAEGSNSNSTFFGAVATNSAIMGHSMGGGASILAAANNTNIKTVVGFAPAETTPSAISAALNISVPALILSGSQDGVTPPANHHLPIYNGLGSTCKTFINVLGGGHCYFANSNFNCDFGEATSSTGISINRLQQHDITFDFVGLWLDYTLKGNCAAFDIFNDSLAVSTRITSQQTCVLNPIPSISDLGGVLESTSGVSYQWYYNNNLIIGATNQQYSPTQSGNYTVEVTYSNGCPELSAIYVFSISASVMLEKSNLFTWSPNPSTGKIFLNQVVEQAQITVYDSQSKVVFQEVNFNGKTLNLEQLPKGVYVIHLQVADKIEVAKIVLQD